jgi:hypothetical protein
MSKEKTILKHKLKDSAHHTAILTKHIGYENLDVVPTPTGTAILVEVSTYTISLLSKSKEYDIVVKYEDVSYDFIIDRYTEVVYSILE